MKLGLTTRRSGEDFPNKNRSLVSPRPGLFLKQPGVWDIRLQEMDVVWKLRRDCFFFFNVVLVGFIAWIPEIPISQSV